jgi:hypothetical protein
MRRLFTAAGSGLTYHALIWGESTGRWRRVQQGVYADGPDDPTPLDRERAKVIASGSPARGGLGGVLLGLDSVTLDGAPIRRTACTTTIVHDTPCADAKTILVDLAATLDDDRWEQVLESALRKRLVLLADFGDLPRGVPGVRRIRRVVARRGDVPPTESLLETLMVQLIRTVPSLPTPIRQRVVTWPNGAFVARVDLSWPDVGIFLELDGQGHKDQPVYDAHRQTSVVAATGWLVGRFTWREVVHTPGSTARRLVALFEQRACVRR